MLKPNVKLFPFQSEGVRFLERNNGCGGIQDTMGLGKTIQAIAYATKHNLKTLVICPAYLKYNWINEVEKFTNNSVSLNIQDQADFTIVNYEVVHKTDIKSHHFDLVICDESQYIMNPKAQRTKATLAIMSSIPKRVLLTGTPIKNKIEEFYDQLKVINPQFVDKKSYMKTYASKNKLTLKSNDTDEKSLRYLHLLINDFCIRREKEDVLKDLPPKLFQVIPVDLTPKANAQYKKIKKLSGLTFISEARKLILKDKIPQICEMIEDHISTDSKVIVFSKSVSLIKYLHNKYSNNSVMHYGGLSPLERNNNIKRFQEDPEVKVLIGNIDTAVGYTATAASNVIFCDLPWTTADLKQAEDRAHRIGQKNSVTVKYIIARGTIEEDILRLLRAKEKLLKGVLTGNMTEEALDIKKELLQCVA
jgi:SWI/SNF-related matrix-associated actin-dependent regulator 1 of chromatin subfamily A